MVAWVLTKSGPIRREARFIPAIYVHGPESDMPALRRELSDHQAVLDTMMVMRRKDIRETEPSRVLKINIQEYRSITDIARLIDAKGAYGRFKLYDVDMSMPVRYLALNGLFPNALVNVGTNFQLMDDISALEYPTPDLKTLKLTRPGRRTYSFNEPLEALEVDGNVLDGSDGDIIEDLLHMVKDQDPDIISTDGGDHFLMPYLQTRAAHASVPFTLDRDKHVRTPFKRKERSYFTYGKIVYKPAPFFLKGRAHLDRSSFLYSESGPHGLLDLSRLAGIPMQQMARLSPGTAISSMQIRQAINDGYIVMWKKNIPEAFKSGRELMTSDRGGFIFEPVVGLHEDVVELDFTSLYPFIIHNYNISPETLNCPCCPDGPVVPGLGYRLCTKRRGIVPKVAYPLIQRRVTYKKKIKEGHPNAEDFRQRANILKWCTVTIFGYTGYRNARFGRIECHESITAYGREILLDASRMAQDMGFEVLHGIVDSMWVKGPTERAQEASESIGNAIGIPLELEGIYKWIVFLPNKTNGVGALNRYYGVFNDGTFKVRGIELRRHDTPEFFLQFQREILDILAQAGGKEEFKELIPDCLAKAREFADRLRNGSVDPQHLIFTKAVSKELEEYSVVNDQACAMYLLKKQGVKVAPGQKVRFVVSQAGSKDPKRRVVPDMSVGPGTVYDQGFYVRHIARALESMISPFKFTEEYIYSKIA